MVDMSDVPPLISDSESESENDSIEILTSPIPESLEDAGTNKNSSNNGTKEEEICNTEEAKPNVLNNVSLTQQSSDSSSDVSTDNDDDHNNDADDHEDAEDEEYESDKDQCSTGVANQPLKMPAAQYPKKIRDTTSGSCANKLTKPPLSSEEKLQSCLQQATLAYFNKNYLSSASEFKIALMMVAQKRKKCKSTETWIIKYCLGLSLINLTLVKEIHDGEKVFQSLIDGDKPTIGILGYLGLAKAYLKQNRFIDAIGPLQDGLRLIGEGFYPPTCCHWPGTLIAIEETNDTPGLLKDTFDALLSECRNPPLPLAVCRYSGCLDPFKTQIYLTDPEFKGFTQVACFEKCLMEFHRDCWRELKSTQLDKRSDKELVNGPCMTPDCNSTVCKISIFGSDGNILKTITGEEGLSKLKKAGQKHKTVSVQHGRVAYQKKVNGKRSKGGASEERAKSDDAPVLADNKSRSGESNHGRDDLKSSEVKMEAARGARIASRRKSLEANGVEEPERNQLSKKKASDPAVTDIDHLVTMQRTDFVALQRKKNEEQDLDSLSKKPKKKRDKERQKKTLHLDEFVEKIETDEGDHVDDPCLEASNYGSQFWEIPPFMTADGSEQDWIKPSAVQSYFPDYLTTETAVSNGNIWSVSSADVKSEKVTGDATVAKNTVEKLKNEPDATASLEAPLETAEDVKGNILSYFEVLLEKLGPCLPDEESVQRELEAFPPDAQMIISEAGGIAKLLLQSLKFNQVDGYICLLKDAAKARQKSRQRRMELIEGRNFVKRFGQLLGKPNPPVTTPDKTSGPISTVSVSIPAVSSSVNSKENKTASASVTTTASTSTTVSSSKAGRKGDNGMFGLCDLNEYKEMLKTKAMSSQVTQSDSKESSIDDDSSLSVIEKFKKEVHKAACKNVPKERIKMMPASKPTTSPQAPVSVNTADHIYNKSSFIDSDKNVTSSKIIGNGTANSTAKKTALSFKDTKGENGNDVKTSTSYLLDMFENPPDTLSNLLDIVDDEDKESKAVDGTNFAGLDVFDLPPVAKVSDVRRSRNDVSLERSPRIKSTLSATATEFHFPKFSSSFKSSGILTQSMTSPNASVTSSSGLVGNYNVYEPGLSSYNYSLNNSSTVSSPNSALSVIRQFQPAPSPGLNFMAGMNSDSCRADNGYGLEHKATNTDQMSFSSDDYDYLKCERDNLLQRCNGFAERLQQMKNKNMEEMQILREKLANAEKKCESLEKESLQWRSEKMIFEEEAEKLRSDLAFTKASLQSANHLVDVTDRLLNETQNALQSEQEQCRSLREKYENLLCQLERSLRSNANKSEAFLPAAVSNATVPVGDQAASKAGKKTKHSFDKIINALSAMFPNLSKIELSRCVQEVRTHRNNSLSGLTVHEIVACVREFILRENIQKQQKKNTFDLPYNMPKSGKQNEGTNGSAYGEEVFQEEVDPCIICHEELNKDSASMLDCGHSFHTECVRKWFREQSTCPTCRNHALLPDEFPALGRPLLH